MRGKLEYPEWVSTKQAHKCPGCGSMMWGHGWVKQRKQGWVHRLACPQCGRTDRITLGDAPLSTVPEQLVLLRKLAEEVELTIMDKLRAAEDGKKLARGLVGQAQGG